MRGNFHHQDHYLVTQGFHLGILLNLQILGVLFQSLYDSMKILIFSPRLQNFLFRSRNGLIVTFCLTEGVTILQDDDNYVTWEMVSWKFT